jgi:ribonuclease HI
MLEDSNQLIIDTVGRWFSRSARKEGIWSAELLWSADDGKPLFDVLKGQRAGTNNIELDVWAVLAGLRAAKDLALPVVVRSVNESVVLTIRDYLPVWKRNGWKNPKGGRPASVEEWKEIDRICEQIEVRWEKRPKGKVDGIKDFEALWSYIEERENELALERALARDPYR